MGDNIIRLDKSFCTYESSQVSKVQTHTACNDYDLSESENSPSSQGQKGLHTCTLLAFCNENETTK